MADWNAGYDPAGQSIEGHLMLSPSVLVKPPSSIKWTKDTVLELS